jgi:AAA domain
MALLDRRTFFSRFRHSTEILPADPSAGEPAIRSAMDIQQRAQVLVKVWDRGAFFTVGGFEELWRREIQYLQAITATAGGREHLAPPLDGSMDEGYLYLAIDAGGRRPLSAFDSKEIDRLGSPDTRILLWQNLQRLAEALGVLHSHGLLHRRIGMNSVLTSLGESADFQLTGFEWSIGLRRTPPPGHVGPQSDAAFSFSSDWKDFGHLARRLLEPLSGWENKFLRAFEDAALLPQVNSTAVVSRLQEVIAEAGSSLDAERTGRLFLIFDAHTHGHLLRPLQSTGRHDPDVDLSRLLRADLSESTLLEVKQRAPRLNRFALRGRRFTYYLKEYGGDGWRLPRLDSVQRDSPDPRFIAHRKLIPGGSLRILDSRALESQRSTVLSEAMPWTDAFPEEGPLSYPVEKSRDVYDALVVLHVLEALYRVAHIWPVTVRKAQAGPGGYTFSVTIAKDTKRAGLSTALGLGDYGERLVELLERDDGSEAWRVNLLEARESEADSWTYLGSNAHSAANLELSFRGSRAFHKNETLQLYPADIEGSIQQMRRRTRLLSTLRDRPELTEMIANPTAISRPSAETVLRENDDLDDAKRDRLNEILATLPLYLLEGPPGTGKSRLLLELIRLCLERGSLTRLLVSSQGHDAIDHLVKELHEQLGEAPDALILRSANWRKPNAPPSPFDIKRQASRQLDQLQGSNLVKEAPRQLQRALSDLRARMAQNDGPGVPDAALESLLLRSANLVFSTTNSGDLESLLDSRSWFDWSIIEESGRATGVELLAPLMLSHRRLLIGDSKQLPPFGEDRILRLVGDGTSLHRAFETGWPLVTRQLSGLDIDYLRERYASEQNIKRLAPGVKGTLNLFASLHAEAKSTSGDLPIAGDLTWQYRMHPRIADVVSRVFYGKRLKTSDEFRKQRSADLRPFRFVQHASHLAHPVVLVDMPWVKKSSRSFAESEPAYSNAREVDAVLRVLKLVRAAPGASDSPPSLAILTPYNEQLRSLSRRINRELSGSLRHLRQFKLRDPIVSTIDAFQGDEADLIIVSMVRNNGRAWFKGLGILGDPRRMNVLLSRAKWSMLLVGSQEFLRKRLPPGDPLTKHPELRFLRKLLREWIPRAPHRHSGRRFPSVIKFRELMQ